jgi:two-component system chemotaxis response regulator CheY
MKQRILLVDDSFYMRTMLKNMLTDAGFTIVGEAADGETAERMAREAQPDLVTLDLILPDNTGLEVLKNMKRHDPDIKVIIVSAVGQDAIVREAMSNGAKAYIVKPFAEEKVLDIVENVLNDETY